jgi:hypothetical protein
VTPLPLLDEADIARLLARATVPEHSPGLMEGLSEGRAFLVEDFLFLHGGDWLSCIGYTLAEDGPDVGADAHRIGIADGDVGAGAPEAAGEAAQTSHVTDPCMQPGTPTGMHDGAQSAGGSDKGLVPSSDDAFPPSFPLKRLEAALADAIAHVKPAQCLVAAPACLPGLAGHVRERDVFHTVPCSAPTPARLKNPIAKARERLHVTEEREFTAAHRRLWMEFLATRHMRRTISELYARTHTVMGTVGANCDLRLLCARNDADELVAAMLCDFSPARFCTYVIGARSPTRDVPHASDLLMEHMLQTARTAGKSFCHLGFGVNEGITRFKRKWGGTPCLPYVLAAWKPTSHGRIAPAPQNGTATLDKPATSPASQSVLTVMRSLLPASDDEDGRRYLEELPEQRAFAMGFEIRKGDALSWLCGSAHFFPYSFTHAFRRLFRNVDTILFEGPLDRDFLAEVARIGRTPEPGSPILEPLMPEPRIRELERTVYGPEGPFMRFLNAQSPRRADVRRLLRETRPWFAFFTLWAAYLQRIGWRESVDRDAWLLGREMGKTVVGMETLEEQLAAMEAIPLPRIVGFLGRCRQWKSCARTNVRAYLAGDPQGMMGTSVEFPTRTEQVIGMRDRRFMERMRPYIEAGRCGVFVGTAHLAGLLPMLQAEGFEVRKVRTGLARLLERLGNWRRG